jgi:hypothetical protein
MRFVVGVVVGVLLAGSAAMATPRIIGDGYLFGWTVTVEGEEVCDTPFVWSGIREIECN